MTRVPITDTDNNQKLIDATEKYARDSIKNDLLSKAAIVAIAALTMLFSKVAMEGIKAIFNQFGNRDRQKNGGLLDDIGDILDLRRGNKSRNIIQRGGNKLRGLVRGGKVKTAAKITKRASKFGKTAKIVRTGRNIKVARNAVKAGKLVRTAKTARTAYKTAKVAKTAHTAYKVAKAAKLANVARIGLQGGMALAGGPVGIALLAGSIVAPYAIESVWKNKDKIYQGGKDLVSKSKLSIQEVTGLLDGKRTKVGEVAPNAKDLKVMGDNKQVLLETDSKGKVLTNNFDPNYKLAFYQQQGQKRQKTMLLDEADLVEPEVRAFSAAKGNVISSITVKPQSGTAVIKGSLAQLKQNNPNNLQIQQQIDFLENNIEAAEVTMPVNTATNSARQQTNSRTGSLVNEGSLKQQKSGNNDNSLTAPPTSAFSQYLPKEDKVASIAGHSKEKSNNMER